MTDQTPRTEAGRRDHDEAWNDDAQSEYHMTHDRDREGCGGCAAIAIIEAEARAEGLDVEVLAEALTRICFMPNHDYPSDLDDHRVEAERLVKEYRAILAARRDEG